MRVRRARRCGSRLGCVWRAGTQRNFRRTSASWALQAPPGNQLALPTAIVQGARVITSGHVRWSPAARVALQVRRRGGWHTLGQSRLRKQRRGRFSVRWQAPMTVGPLKLRLVLRRHGKPARVLAAGTVLIKAATRSPGGLDATQTTLKCAPSTVSVGQSTTCTVVVVNDVAAEPKMPEGDVSITDGVGAEPKGSMGQASASAAEKTESCSLHASGTSNAASCVFEYSPPGVGSDHLSASYPGDSEHSPSQSASFTVTAQGRRRR